MASRRKKEERFNRLLQLAQVMKIMGEPAAQAAQLEQSDRNSKMQAVLALLGIENQGKLASEDRAFRTKEGEASRAAAAKEGDLSRALQLQLQGGELGFKEKQLTAEQEKNRGQLAEQIAGRLQQGQQFQTTHNTQVDQFLQKLAEDKALREQTGKIAGDQLSLNRDMFGETKAENLRRNALALDTLGLNQELGRGELAFKVKNAADLLAEQVKGREQVGRLTEAEQRMRGSQFDRSHQLATDTFESERDRALRALGLQERLGENQMQIGLEDLDLRKKTQGDNAALGKEQIAAGVLGHKLDFLRGSYGVTGVDANKLAVALNLPGVSDYAQGNIDKAMRDTVSAQSNIMRNTSPDKAYSVFKSQTPDVQAELLKQGGFNFGANDNTDFLPSSWSKPAPSVLDSAGVQVTPGVSVGGYNPDELLQIGPGISVPMPKNNKSLREYLFGNPLDPNNPGLLK